MFVLRLARFCSKDIQHQFSPENFTEPLKQAKFVFGARPEDISAFRKMLIFRC